jgi:hypothetical protein
MRLLRFFTGKEYLDLGAPVPMKNIIPEWYKKAETRYSDEQGNWHAGVKKCMPVLDSLVSGYALTTPFDIFITRSESGDIQMSWSGPDSLSYFVGERPKELGQTMPRPAGHDPNHMVWSGFWGFKAPRGWSILVTHPLNRFDLPFTTTSGIIDSDKFSASGNLPFFIKEGFTGMIPAGTPIAQLIPIKRSNWKMIIDKGMRDLEILQGTVVRDPETPYKRTMWQRKDYS